MVGKYHCSTNVTVQTLTNCPTTEAFMMEVFSPLSTTYDNETTSQWVYRLRKITTYTGHMYIQFVNSGSTAGPFTYGAWYKIYSDGWIEQGGLVKVAMRPGTTTVKLLKKYSDTNFTVLLGNNSNAESNPFVDSKTVSTIVLSRSYTGQQSVAGNSYWYTCGY